MIENKVERQFYDLFERDSHNKQKILELFYSTEYETKKKASLTYQLII